MIKITIPVFARAIGRGARMLLVFALAGLLLAPQTSHMAVTAPSDLDTTFGMGGKVRTDFTGGIDRAGVIALQADGKIVVGGLTVLSNIPESPQTFGLARYNLDGSLDLTFGSGGKVGTGFGPPGFGGSSIGDMAIQPDNKIVAAGFNGSVADLHGDAVVARYTLNGSLDATFGSGGRVTIHFAGSISAANAIALQPDGRMIIGGYDITPNATPDTVRALARINANGALDPTFGSGGKVLSSKGRIRRLALQPDGKIVAVGESAPMVQRFNPNGSLDATFGSGGEVDTPGFGLSANDVALQVDGKIVCAGSAHNGSDIALIRYNPNGSLDTSFGSGGVAINDLGNDDAAYGVAIQSNGKIVIAGTSNQKFTVLRYNSNGTLDPTFNPGPPDFGCMDPPSPRLFDYAADPAIQVDGKIVAAGSACLNTDFVLARYIGDPAFDYCVQDESNGNLLKLNSITGDYQFMGCRSGLTLGGKGTLIKRGSLLFLQVVANDRRIMASIDRGTNRGTASVQVFSPASNFTIMDRNISNNSCACP